MPNQPEQTWDYKKSFEANYLDGDKVQDGQMLSSETCLEAIKDALSEQRERMLGCLPEEANHEFNEKKNLTHSKDEYYGCCECYEDSHYLKNKI